jgi:hypothetical protein
MLRRILVVSLLLLPSMGSGRAPAQAPGGGEVASFSRTKAMKHVWRLSNRIGVRVRGTEGERRGARYIKGRFEALGYETEMQKFSVDGRTSRNVIAWSSDVIAHPFVVGAHMDTVEHSPGANDNASGTAIVLEIARLLRGHERSNLFKFVAFGSEEYGDNGRHHIGSEVFVDSLGKTGRSRSPGMISVDMVADGKPLLVGNSGIAGDVVADELLKQVRNANIGVRFRTSCDCSDNGPFERAGIPASYMYSGDEPDYHSSSDTVWNLKPEHLHRSGRAVRAFLLSLNEGDLRRFRNR